MTQHSSLQKQAEQWASEAKRLVDSGQEAAGFDLYRKAAEALPGAPWLQHRTGEVARKVKQDELAVIYFRRSAQGFRAAGFEKRALAPLRLAWSCARDGLPRTVESFVEVAYELVALLTALRMEADAESALELSNDALRRVGLKSLQRVSSPMPNSGPTWAPTLRPQASEA